MGSTAQRSSRLIRRGATKASGDGGSPHFPSRPIIKLSKLEYQKLRNIVSAKPHLRLSSLI